MCVQLGASQALRGRLTSFSAVFGYCACWDLGCQCCITTATTKSCVCAPALCFGSAAAGLVWRLRRLVGLLCSTCQSCCAHRGCIVATVGIPLSRCNNGNNNKNMPTEGLLQEHRAGHRLVMHGELTLAGHQQRGTSVKDGPYIHS
jgi:hypothetical protein